MKNWSVQEAKARFSELVETCLAEGPQMVTKRGAETAVLVPLEEWQHLQRSRQRTLKELLLAPEARYDDLEIPERGSWRMRPPIDFDADPPVEP